MPAGGPDSNGDDRSVGAVDDDDVDRIYGSLHVLVGDHVPDDRLVDPAEDASVDRAGFGVEEAGESVLGSSQTGSPVEDVLEERLEVQGSEETVARLDQGHEVR